MEWACFDGTRDQGGSYQLGAPLGPAKTVCINAATPSNSPPHAVIYSTTAALASFQVAILRRSFDLDDHPRGTMQIAVDDFAQVFVNDVPVGSTGSLSEVHDPA